MFIDSTIIPLFPTLVWKFELSPQVYEPLNTRLALEIERLLSPRPLLEPGRIWQTHHDLHTKEEFEEVNSIIHQGVGKVLDVLGVESLPIQVTGCWANISPPMSPHDRHHHPNNFLSGIYYVRTPDGADGITFHDPREGIYNIWPRIRQHNIYNTPHIRLEVKAGSLLIFPSWAKHSVPVNRSKYERISIAFNVMFSSFSQSISPPAWTGINTAAK